MIKHHINSYNELNQLIGFEGFRKVMAKSDLVSRDYFTGEITDKPMSFEIIVTEYSHMFGVWIVSEKHGFTITR